MNNNNGDTTLRNKTSKVWEISMDKMGIILLNTKELQPFSTKQERRQPFSWTMEQRNIYKEILEMNSGRWMNDGNGSSMYRLQFTTTTNQFKLSPPKN